MGNECFLGDCRKRNERIKSPIGSNFFSSFESDRQPMSASQTVASPVRAYYEANVYRMSSDVQALFKAHFTGAQTVRIARILKPITREEAHDLSFIISAMPGTESISFAVNQLGPESLVVLLPAFERLNKLSKLRISQNELADDGAVALAKTLPKLQALQDLILDENHIGDKGAASLGKAFPECKQLLLIDLSKNAITQDGLQKLLTSCRGCLSLKHLKLTSNRFDPPLSTDSLPFQLTIK